MKAWLCRLIGHRYGYSPFECVCGERISFRMPDVEWWESDAPYEPNAALRKAARENRDLLDRD